MFVIQEHDNQLILGRDFLNHHGAMISCGPSTQVFFPKANAHLPPMPSSTTTTTMVAGVEVSCPVTTCDELTIPPSSSVRVRASCTTWLNQEEAVLLEPSPTAAIRPSIRTPSVHANDQTSYVVEVVNPFPHKSVTLQRGTVVAYASPINLTDLVDGDTEADPPTPMSVNAIDVGKGDGDNDPHPAQGYAVHDRGPQPTEEADHRSPNSAQHTTRQIIPTLRGSVSLQEALRQLSLAFSSIWHDGNKILPTTPLIEHVINLQPNTHPAYARPRRFSHHELSELLKIVRKLIKEEIIEEASSPWAAPIVVVTKANGDIRFCGDYRRLNSTTIFDPFPPPHRDEAGTRLHGMKIFSQADVKSAYWTIKMSHDCKPLTAFSVPGAGQYQYKRMPFGLVGAGATFARLMAKTFRGIEELRDNTGKVTSVLVTYVDDIIWASISPEEHIRHTELVFRRISNANLALAAEKTTLGDDHVKWLGLIIAHDGIKADPAKTLPIINFPRPHDKASAERFIGMVAFYHPFMEQLSSMVKPIRDCVGLASRTRARSLIWNEAAENAFADCKTALATSPTLAFPNYAMRDTQAGERNATPDSRIVSRAQLRRVLTSTAVTFASCDRDTACARVLGVRCSSGT